MKMFASICAVLVAAVLGWAGLAAPAAAEIRTARASSPSAAATGIAQSAASLFNTHCAKCHGTDGKAQTQQGKATGARDFNSPRWKARTSVEEAAAAIRDGYEEMPSYKKRFTAAQIQALAEYSKSFPH